MQIQTEITPAEQEKLDKLISLKSELGLIIKKVDKLIENRDKPNNDDMSHNATLLELKEVFRRMQSFGKHPLK